MDHQSESSLSESNLPLSFAQQRLWFLEQLEEGGVHYLITNVFRLRGSLQVEIIQRSIQKIVQRHDILRTTFALAEGQPILAITEPRTVILSLIDLQQVSREELEAQVQILIAQEATVSFDLTLGPLWRVRLLRIGAQEHVLLLTTHHLIFDDWSVRVFFTELVIHYEALMAGHPAPLETLRMQYMDFALWQREFLQGEVLEKHLAYWLQQLAQASVLLELPTDHPRPAVQTFHMKTVSFSLPRELSKQVKVLSQQEDVTLFMTLLATFQVILYRYTGQEDIIVGTSIANRCREELEDLIGLFMNTLVIRIDLSGEPTFREVLHRLRDVVLKAYMHQDLPLERLVNALRPDHTLSHVPLFQVRFILSTMPIRIQKMHNLTVFPELIGNAPEKFDLTLFMREVGEDIIAHIKFDSGLFEQETIERLSGHYQQLLWSMVAGVEQRISHSQLLTDKERWQILVEWNETQQVEGERECIHRLFEVQVKRTPEAIVLVCEEMQLTYRKLNKRANQLGRQLQKLGVGPESLVGLCMERSVELVIGILAILKAGGAYVPLDPRYPQERLAYILQDIDARVVVMQRHLKEQLAFYEGYMVCLEAGEEIEMDEGDENLDSRVEEDNLAYVLYTSGSTGLSKAVCMPHFPAVQHFRSYQRTMHIESCDRALQFAAFTFDPSLEQLFPYLFCGACVVMRVDLWGSEEFIRNISIYGLTTVDLTTAYWQQLTKEWKNETKSDIAQHLRLITVGGDVLLPEYLRIWHTISIEAVQLLNTYGPTEATITATAFNTLKVPHDAMVLPSVPIGYPLDARKMYILDRNMFPTPVGVRGEIYIGGEMQARGYLKDPELTAERFLPDPFIAEQGARMYRTGDLGRYLPDGAIEFMGRVDNQVKVRGFRIELGEIESVLSQHPDIKATVVIVRERTEGDKQLVAYIVVSENEKADFLSSSALRRFVQDRLPEYMIPSVFVKLPQLPLTPHGKIDRRALPPPDFDRPTENSLCIPRNTVEKILIEIWCQTLGLAQIGVYDNFFELGGDSILSIQIASHAKQFGLYITPKIIYQHQTIADLAPFVVVSTMV